jgi:hypothetical protein
MHESNNHAWSPMDFGKRNSYIFETGLGETRRQKPETRKGPEDTNPGIYPSAVRNLFFSGFWFLVSGFWFLVLEDACGVGHRLLRVRQNDPD